MADGRALPGPASAGELWLDRRYGLLPLLAKTPWWLLRGRFHSGLGWWREMRELARAGGFDPSFYRLSYPDVARSAIDPLYHYVRYGAREGRLPHAYHGQRDTPVSMQTAPTPWGQVCDMASVSHTPDLTPGPLDWRMNPGHAGSRAPGSRPVLLVSHDAYRGGAQLLLLELARSLVQRPDLEVFLLLLGPGDLEADFRACAHTLQLQGAAAAGTWQRSIESVVSGIAARKPLLALCNTVASSPVALACRRAGVPVLALIHELPTSIDSTLGRQAVLDLVDSSRGALLDSDFLKAALIDRYRIPSERLSVLRPSAFDWDQGPGWREECRARVIQEFGLPSDAFLVLGCGTIQPRKGTDLFVQLAREATALLGGEPLAFLWVGPEEPSPQFRVWCEHDIRIAGLDSRVRLAGGRDLMRDYFGAADAFALTSREDPFPLVVLDAMARGVPVLAFQSAGGAPEALAGGGGIVVPYLDVREMARGLIRLCQAPHYHREISQNAVRSIQADYRWSRYMDGLLAVLQRDFGYRLRG